MYPSCRRNTLWCFKYDVWERPDYQPSCRRRQQKKEYVSYDKWHSLLLTESATISFKTLLLLLHISRILFQKIFICFQHLPIIRIICRTELSHCGNKNIIIPTHTAKLFHILCPSECLWIFIIIRLFPFTTFIQYVFMLLYKFIYIWRYWTWFKGAKIQNKAVVFHLKRLLS